MPTWVNRPEGSNWGDFGPDDQLGTLNHITQSERLAAVAEIREGRAFGLSLPLDLPGKVQLNPRRKPPRLAPTCLGETPYINYPLSNVDPLLKDVLSDDQVLLSTQYSTQWDSLAHVGALFDADGDGVAERVYYNGHRAEVDVLGEGEGDHGSYARRLSVCEMAKTPIQGRGVLVDFTRHFGRERVIVTRAILEDVLAKDGIEVRPGDILMLRTGFAEALIDMQGDPDPERLSHHVGAVLDGTDSALHQWITDSRIAAIAADNYAVENPDTDPHACCLRLPLHHHCLFKLGLPLAELWYLRDLAEALNAAGRHAMLLTAPPLYLPGAIGSPVTPVATI